MDSKLQSTHYPENLKRKLTLCCGSITTIRPIAAEDERIERAFIEALLPRSSCLHFCLHFLGAIGHPMDKLKHYFTHVDYATHMALIATVRESHGEQEISVSRYIANIHDRACFFAIVVADEWQGNGIGCEIMADLIRDAPTKTIQTMKRTILVGNRKMVEFVRYLG